MIAAPFEGLRLEPYYCPAGFPTIGYGRLLSVERHADLSRWPTVTETQAEIMLEEDMARHLQAAIALIEVPLLDCQWAALADFTYNLGPGRLRASTLRRVINGEGPDEDIAREFRKWRVAGGRILRGLVRRREAEIAMWVSGLG